MQFGGLCFIFAMNACSLHNLKDARAPVELSYRAHLLSTYLPTRMEWTLGVAFAGWGR